MEHRSAARPPSGPGHLEPAPGPVERPGLNPVDGPNITPLIDILLVLLIIFMATLPLSQEGIDLSLPRAAEERPAGTPSSHVVLQYSAGRQLTINHRPVSLGGVQERLREIFAARHDKTLYIDADPSLRYGDVVPLVDAAKGAGVQRVGIITPGLKAGR